MKKLLFLLFASLLVLGACGQKEESSSKDETKDAKKEVKKEKKKGTDEKEKNSEKKTEEKSTEEVATNEQQTNEQQSTEEVNSTEQQPTEDVNTTEQPTQEQAIQEQQDAYGKPSGQYDTNGPTYEEDENGNWKEIPKEDTEEESYSADNPYMNLPDQEWRKNTGGLSSGEIQTRNAIKNGTYEGEDAEQILEAINYYEQQYGK